MGSPEKISARRPSTVEEFSAIARRLLPEADVEYWISLLRPTVRIRHAEAGQTTIGHLAGDPDLPPDMPWPTAPWGAPLTHLMTLDLAALPDIGLGLPKGGLLQFYCFADEGNEGRVLHIPSDLDVATRPSPSELYVRAHVPITGTVETTAPGTRYDHTYLDTMINSYEGVEVDEDGEEYDAEHPLCTDAWDEAVGTTLPNAYHLIGGYGVDIQYPADFAPSATPVAVRDEDGELRPETDLPVLLTQIDTDYEAGIGWGDVGISHWTISREDLAAHRFDRVQLTWSCH